MGLGERKAILIARARALDRKARTLTQDTDEWADGFKELKREISYLFRDMGSLNDELKARKHVEIAPTTFVQEVVRLILSVSNRQISVEEARVQSIALIPAPDALRAVSRTGVSETHQSPGIKAQVGVVASLDPQPTSKDKNADQREDSEEAEEDRQLQEFRKIKEEQIDRKTAPGPMPRRYVDDRNEVQESKGPTIQGPSLLPCERCVKSGRPCLAFNSASRSVCVSCAQKRVRCSNSRKSIKQAAMGETANGDQPEPKAQSRGTVAPRRQALTRRVEELEQVIKELKAEVVKRERNDQLEEAILTMSTFIQQHTASVDTRLQKEQETAKRIRALEETLLGAGIPIPQPVPEPNANGALPVSISSISSIPSLPRKSTVTQADFSSLSLPQIHSGRKRSASQGLNVPKRSRSE